MAALVSCRLCSVVIFVCFIGIHRSEARNHKKHGAHGQEKVTFETPQITSPPELVDPGGVQRISDVEISSDGGRHAVLNDNSEDTSSGAQRVAKGDLSSPTQNTYTPNSNIPLPSNSSNTSQYAQEFVGHVRTSPKASPVEDSIQLNSSKHSMTSTLPVTSHINAAAAVNPLNTYTVTENKNSSQPWTLLPHKDQLMPSDQSIVDGRPSPTGPMGRTSAKIPVKGIASQVHASPSQLPIPMSPPVPVPGSVPVVKTPTIRTTSQSPSGEIASDQDSLQLPVGLPPAGESPVIAAETPHPAQSRAPAQSSEGQIPIHAPDSKPPVRTPDAPYSVQAPESDAPVQAPASSQLGQVPQSQPPVQGPDAPYSVQVPQSKPPVQGPDAPYSVQTPQSKVTAQVPNGTESVHVSQVEAPGQSPSQVTNGQQPGSSSPQQPVLTGQSSSQSGSSRQPTQSGSGRQPAQSSPSNQPVAPGIEQVQDSHSVPNTDVSQKSGVQELLENEEDVEVDIFIGRVSPIPTPYQSDNSSFGHYFDPRFYEDLMHKYRSKDGFWALLCLSVLMIILVAAVWYTKMWKQKDSFWEGDLLDMETSHQHKPRYSIKDLVAAQFKFFPKLSFKKKKKKEVVIKAKKRSRPFKLTHGRKREYLADGRESEIELLVHRS